MTERKLRSVPERDVVAKNLAYGSSSDDLELQKLLNEVVGKSFLNNGNLYKEHPTQFTPPWNKQD